VIILYILLALVGIILLLLLAAVVHTLFMPSKKTEYTPSQDKARIDAYADKLSRMVQCETVSDRSNPDVEKFRAFHKVMEQLFPTVFASCEKTDLDGNLILKWKGKSDKDPILLMSHMDVVEASGEWKYPHFSGARASQRKCARAPRSHRTLCDAQILRAYNNPQVYQVYSFLK